MASRDKVDNMPDFGVGDVVTVRGYGGMAEVLSMEIDGYTPQGFPKYLCTVQFGAYEQNETIKKINLPYGPYRKGPRDRIHQFYAGRMANAFPELAETDFEREMREVEEEIAELKAKLAERGTPS
jgi:hypothetical protein